MSFWTRLFKGVSGEKYENGIRLFNEGRYDEAVALLEDVIAETSSRGSPIAKLGAFYAAEAHAKIGIALFYQGKLDAAFTQFETALRANPHYPDLFRLFIYITTSYCFCRSNYKSGLSGDL